MLVFLSGMKHRTIIFYDLKGKSNSQRSRALQKLYGYRDKSNYNYSYERKGMLNGIPHQKSYKVALEIKKSSDISKVAEILNQLHIEFEIAKI